MMEEVRKPETTSISPAMKGFGGCTMQLLQFVWW